MYTFCHLLRVHNLGLADNGNVQTETLLPKGVQGLGSLRRVIIRTASLLKTYERPLVIVVDATTHLEIFN